MHAWAASILLIAMSDPAGQPLTHPQEIAAFASTMAIVRTVSENCDGTLVNTAYIEDLRHRLHVVEADHPMFVDRAREVVASLKSALATAPSREAWCDNLFALYGPNGTMIPMLLQRQRGSR